ncbi:pectate lyase superfamily protein-domain-containing protein [Aspergillus nidulans var. acristatus]
MLLLRAITSALCWAVLASLVTSHGHHAYQHFHHAHGSSVLSTPTPESSPAQEVPSLIENIHFNKHEFKDPDTPMPKEAPALDTITISGNVTKQSKSDKAFTYSIPENLREAARIIAKSAPPATPKGDHEQVAADICRKYALYTNDTNVPPQQLRQADGLMGYVDSWEDRGVSSTNESSAETTETKAKRATNIYWMTAIEQHGRSPFVLKKYQVWRNVMDYGAKGNANCSSSTIYPAVMYFLPGIYLVSSSIIQYYNMQFLGDLVTVPTILAASSFVSLGVIISDVYNNFLQSVKNFKINICLTDPNAYVCAIHWQVAQGTLLENIEFYALADTTQQGVYMENSSGRFLSNLMFQFTTSHLVFVNCNTALQIHWDWAWTMQDIVIEFNGQPVGSLILTDILIANQPTGIVTSLHAENLTALLVQNTGFFNVKDAIVDQVLSKTLVAGGDEVFLDNWGFGMLSTKSGSSCFVNSQSIPYMNHTTSLLAETGYMNRNFFTRRRPKYYDISILKIMDVKALRAKGDGVIDNSPILNVILDTAANLSSIVYFPFGVYVVKVTLKVPLGSQIIGQAWSQIMGTGPKFQNELEPRAVVKVGEPGNISIVEIQDMLFTVSGKTAGAVLMEWNVHESTQGSAGLWDSYFCVGGAVGSNLQAEDCPSLSRSVNPACKAAVLLLHLMPQSSAYLENVWVWVADHDLDKITQDQINIYVARGVLIESQGPTWLYGTASEHCEVVLGMIQTELPYYQPVPKAPRPFSTGLFKDDPTFNDCPADLTTCALSWGVRIIDSKTVYVLGAGLYSWYSGYSQDYLETNNCQQRAVYIKETSNLWIYNLCIKAIIKIVLPVSELITYAADNHNGFLSSILAWVRNSSDTTVGERHFEGFCIYLPGNRKIEGLTKTCQTALTQTINCHNKLQGWQQPEMHTSLKSKELTDKVCNSGCGCSLQSYYNSVVAACQGQNFTVAAGTTFPERAGGTIWTGYNETCLQDPSTGEYCNSTSHQSHCIFTNNELCSPCYVNLHRTMQSSPYSIYHVATESNQYPVKSGSTSIKDPQYIPVKEDTVPCFTKVTYMTKSGDTCNTIARSFSVASGALQSANSNKIYNCTGLQPDKELCIPMTCDKLYILQDTDTCQSIELDNRIRLDNLRAYNPWINYTGYTTTVTQPPANAMVAEGTILACGKWYTVTTVGNTCAEVCTQTGITADLFRTVNPSLAGNSAEDCTGLLKQGLTYCVGPVWDWDREDDD